ncbi:MAG: hypothetical protein WAW92_03665, partial [Minisyncoccia bacterium]
MKSFFPFFIIALCVGVFFMYMKPTFSVINERKEKLTEYQNVLDKVKEIKAKRDQLSSQYG